MDSFLAATGARRRDLCEQAGERLGLQAASIEKDYWVCLVLQSLVGLVEIGPQITFKGGTSLSKVWKLIQRFSEDVDLVIDRRLHGFAGERAPEQAGISGKERDRRLQTLGNWCRAHVEDRVRPALESSLREQPSLPWPLTGGRSSGAPRHKGRSNPARFGCSRAPSIVRPGSGTTMPCASR